MGAARGLAVTLLRGASRLLRPLVRAGAAAAPPPEPQMILWIRLDHIGDVVMSLPALAALRARFPTARIDALVRPAVAPLLRGVPGIDNLLTYDTPRFPEQGRGAGLFRTLALVRRLRRARYDVAVEMRGDEIGRLLAWLAGVPCRIGPDRIFYEAPGTSAFAYLLTNTVAVPDAPRAAVEANLAVLAPLGIEAAPVAPVLAVDDEARAAVAEKLRRLNVEGPFATIHARSNDAARDWTDEKFARVAAVLARDHGLPVVLSGTARDHDDNERIIRLAGEASIHNAAGLFRLEELPAFYSGARLMVTVDTGPMHIAAAVGTPIVALFRPELAPRHAPYGQRDVVVTAPDGGAVADIDVAAVLKSIATRLQQ